MLLRCCVVVLLCWVGYGSVKSHFDYKLVYPHRPPPHRNQYCVTHGWVVLLCCCAVVVVSCYCVVALGCGVALLCCYVVVLLCCSAVAQVCCCVVMWLCGFKSFLYSNI